MNKNKIYKRTLTMLALTVIGLSPQWVLAQSDEKNKITFDDHVKPILMQRCSTCHNGNGKKEGDLDVTNFTALMTGGGSGEVISPGSAADSYLHSLITHSQSPEMPPDGNKIPESEIGTIAKWIDRGALQNAGSKAQTNKPKADLTLDTAAITRPKTVAMPLRMPLEPAIKTARPSATAIATSPWAPLAAIASPKQILLYHTQSLELLGVLPMPEGVAHELTFSRNGSLLLAGGGRGGANGKTILWDVKTGQRVTSIGEEMDSILAADLTSNQSIIAMGGPQKVVRVISISDGQLIFEIRKHTDWISAIEFSPDGKYLATGDRNGGLFVWETETGSEMFALKGHKKSITDLSWRSDSKVLASISEDTNLKTWEMKKGAQLKTWAAHAQGATAVEFLRNGNLVSSGRDQLARLWDQNGKPIRQFTGLTDIAVSVSYCDETNRVLAADWTGQIKVWNAADGKMLGHLAANPLPLAQRLAAAQQVLALAKQNHSPLAADAKQTQANLTEAASALTTAQQSLTKKQAQISQTDKQLAAMQQQFDSTKLQHERWRQELVKKNAALPAVSEAHQKSIAALKALPEDAELSQSVKQLQAKVVQISNRIKALKDLVANSDQKKQTTKTMLNQLLETANGQRQQMSELTKQTRQLQAQTVTLSKEMEAKKKLVAVAQAGVDRAKLQCDRWTESIHFAESLKLLESQLAQKESAIGQQQAGIDQAQQALNQAKQKLDQQQQQRQSIEAKAAAIRQKILELRGGL